MDDARVLLLVQLLAADFRLLDEGHVVPRRRKRRAKIVADLAGAYNNYLHI